MKTLRRACLPATCCCPDELIDLACVQYFGTLSRGPNPYHLKSVRGGAAPYLCTECKDCHHSGCLSCRSSWARFGGCVSRGDVARCQGWVPARRGADAWCRGSSCSQGAMWCYLLRHACEEGLGGAAGCVFDQVFDLQRVQRPVKGARGPFGALGMF